MCTLFDGWMVTGWSGRWSRSYRSRGSVVAAINACPKASPPSFAGTLVCSSTGKPSTSKRLNELRQLEATLRQAVPADSGALAVEAAPEFQLLVVSVSIAQVRCLVRALVCTSISSEPTCILLGGRPNTLIKA